MSGFFAFQIVISDDREGGRGLEGLISIRIVPDRRAQRRGSKSRRRCQFAPISLSLSLSLPLRTPHGSLVTRLLSWFVRPDFFAGAHLIMGLRYCVSDRRSVDHRSRWIISRKGFWAAKSSAVGAMYI